MLDSRSTPVADKSRQLLATLEKLEGRFAAAAAKLDATIVEPIRTGQPPDSAALAECQALVDDYTAAAAALAELRETAAPNSPVKEMAAGLRRRLEAEERQCANVRLDLERVRCIRHTSGNPPPYLSDIARRISELLDAPTSGTDTDTSAAPFREFLRLVEHRDELTESDADQAASVVEAVFGRAVATAALLGKLTMAIEDAGPRATDDSAAPAAAEPAEGPPALRVAETGSPTPKPDALATNASPPAAAVEVAPVEPPAVTTPNRPLPPTTTDEPDRSIPGPMVLERPTPDGAAAREAIWSLLEADRCGLAYQIARCANALELCHTEEPADLFRAAALARHVHTAFGEVVDGMREAIASLGPLTAPQNEQGLASAVLRVALALRPALLSPGAGAVALLDGGALDRHMPELAKVLQAVAKFGMANLELSPSVLKGVRDHAQWEDRGRRLRDDARGWLESNRQASIIYAHATNVWHKWLEDASPLGVVLLVIARDGRGQAAVVRAAAAEWSQVRNVEKHLHTTDRELRGAGAHRRPIEARAVTAIRERAKEFVRRATEWADHVDAEPRALDDFRQRQADATREAVSRALPAALDEVRRLRTSGGATAALPAALTYLERALLDLRDLFDINHEVVTDAPSVRVLLGEELLADPAIVLSEDWSPLAPSGDDLLGRLLSLAAVPYDPEAAFEAQTAVRNHAATGRVVEALRTRTAAGELAEQLDRRRDEEIRLCRLAFRRQLDDTRASVERAVCYDLIGGDERNSCQQLVEGFDATLDMVLDFADATAELQKKDDSIAERRKDRVRQLERQLEELTSGGVLAERQSDLAVIRDALAAEDFLSAGEYLELVRNGQPLVRPADQTRLVLREFFAGSGEKPPAAAFAQKFNDFMEGKDARQKPLPRDLIDRVRRGESIGPIDMAGVPGPQCKDAATMLDSWLRLKEMRDARPDPARDLVALLSGFGFRDVAVEPARRWKSPHWLAMCRTAVLRDRNDCVVPGYGSGAKGRYRVLAVYDRPDEETLVKLCSDAPGAEPLIVLYFGRMTEQRRRDLAKWCWSREQPFLTVDESVVFFLAGERFSRLPILFQCALPFTLTKPYTTTASEVPVEMFFGRKQERAAVLDTHGTNLVYGGRQLGKSALLRDVERREHNPAAGRIVRWIDLKTRNIGIDRPYEEIWTEIGKEMHELGVLTRPVSNPQTVRDKVQEWLAADEARRILLLLDEADAFLDADSRKVDSKTRYSFPEVARLIGLMNDTGRRFKVVFAGLHNVQRAARDPNTPLGHMGQPVCIGPLLDDGEWRQARDLIEMPLRHMGFELQPPDLWMRVLSHTNYYPSLIQVFCKNLLDFLHNRDRTKFDFRRCPPYPVTAEQIEQVYQSKAVRDEIKHKFELTLGLDDRYRLIALRIALASLDPGGARADGYDVAWVRDEALSWWPGGFPADGRSFEQFRTILDEMVGLGVLRRAGADGYALRSPNVLNLFGSKGQIETSLIDVSSRQPPQVYEAASFRRALGSDPWTRSPLTADQEALLAERANGVVLVFGSRPGGLDRLVEALGAVPNLAAGVAVSRRLSQVGQFEEWLRQFDESRDKQAEAVALAVVDASCDWAPHWVVKAEAYLKRKTTSKRKFLRVAFVADPALAWDWVAEDDPPVAAKEFTLRPWQETALRRWIADAELGPDAVNECGRVREVTGGWHQLIETFGQRCRDNPQNWRAVLDGLRANRPEAADWAVPPAARELVETLAQMGQPLTEAELSEFCSPPTAARALRWADRLGYAVKDVGDDAIVRWALDPLVSRAFAARGGG